MKKLTICSIIGALSICVMANANIVQNDQKPANDETSVAQSLVEIQKQAKHQGRQIMYLKIDIHDCSMKRYRVDNIESKPQLVLEEEYVVGTPKVKEYPHGRGIITEINVHPWWYPTQETVIEFKKRHIDLEKFRNDEGLIAVPPGHRLNFMGSAKMKITFIDKQKTAKLRRSVYRIHGNNDPTKLGTRCTGGCIRMDNDEVKDLAKDSKGKTVIIDYI